jgi:hypothetical protein
MRISRIVNEFLEYRTYVSHTLCKHRLLMGLTNPVTARRKFDDAAVWPFIERETTRLFELSGTLFGLESPELRDQIGGPVLAALSLINANRLTLSDDQEGFKRLERAALDLHNLLSAMEGVLRRYRPSFSEKAVLNYLNGKDSVYYRGLFQIKVREIIAPTILEVIGSSASNGESYSRFWVACGDVYLAYRVVLIATAIGEAPQNSEASLRNAYKVLQSIEGFVSCWSPNIDPVSRPSFVKRWLDAEGLSSVDELVSQLKHCEEFE